MKKNKKRINHEKLAIVFLWIFLIFALLYSFFFKRNSFIDVIAGVLLGLLFTRYHDKIQMKPWMYWLVFFSMVGALVGSFYFFKEFIIGPIGFDKVLHFFTSFAGAVIVANFFISSKLFKKKSLLFFVMVVLVVLGVGAIMEVVEFSSNRYLGIGHPQSTFFALEDNLPEIRSDLQTFDTFFDLIFEMIGASFGLLLYSFIERKKKRKKKKKTNINLN